MSIAENCVEDELYQSIEMPSLITPFLLSGNSTVAPTGRSCRSGQGRLGPRQPGREIHEVSFCHRGNFGKKIVDNSFDNYVMHRRRLFVNDNFPIEKSHGVAKVLALRDLTRWKLAGAGRVLIAIALPEKVFQGLQRSRSFFGKVTITQKTIVQKIVRVEIWIPC